VPLATGDQAGAEAALRHLLTDRSWVVRRSTCRDLDDLLQAPRLRREADAVVLGGPTAYHVVAAIAWCFGMIVVFGSLSIARYRSTT